MARTSRAMTGWQPSCRLSTGIATIVPPVHYVGAHADEPGHDEGRKTLPHPPPYPDAHADTPGRGGTGDDRAARPSRRTADDARQATPKLIRLRTGAPDFSFAKP